ncbi:aliphatic sulfonate ABC transporter substrate-binding protein [Aetokthonos hydrillicola Thurmond2011]|jgi:sulfonate transport system substrate-binding protein|uniref:Putative aliphatic sulfonates-binding protein n=1 Tax=Aetokthonos hydrillicola Thurmond2011 TaxID=2712845 RepID=A0AAP5M817_9CYAN|nr:aliphatic sulfonate ABC transporter substrate-binding protein [Aetokthonos hydrillicola]MBO3460499.1 aliphatic sulfonate ABC transporter substrate-binding protein [Aetokthonos hydrillicola CCALA 1050]MBW4588213.1 aliphatic sulfonate ABC transporter substrate-binding protein [Aetokthonos hydrillicola CCALA 1050]MDR9893103.1 aliphatic sulfonate ABC transporter substrate-binding protein [Aetokthonos hydrillicola Thurmond2011]
MIKPYVRKRLISRRDLLYTLYGLTSFSILVGCGVNAGSKDQKTTENKNIIASNGSTTNSKTKRIRLGYTTFGDLTREKGVIEKRLAPLGINVTWTKFVSGPPLLEALSVGSIDGGQVGETPPIFAQAAGNDLVYLVNIPAGTGESYGIIVPKDSPIKTVADLRGKKVAYARGTALTYFLAKALEEVGLKFSDVQGVNLTVADGRAAFLNKTVDAYVAIDPTLIKFQQDGTVRLLRDAQGIKTPGSFYLSSRDFATNNIDLFKAILEEYYEIGEWANKNRRATAEILAPQLKIDVPTMEIMLSRRKYNMQPINEEVLRAQQEVADLLYKLKIVPKQVDVRQATLTSQQYAAIIPESIKNRA